MLLHVLPRKIVTATDQPQMSVQSCPRKNGPDVRFHVRKSTRAISALTGNSPSPNGGEVRDRSCEIWEEGPHIPSYKVKVGRQTSNRSSKIEGHRHGKVPPNRRQDY